MLLEWNPEVFQQLPVLLNQSDLKLILKVYFKLYSYLDLHLVFISLYLFMEERGNVYVQSKSVGCT